MQHAPVPDQPASEAPSRNTEFATSIAHPGRELALTYIAWSMLAVVLLLGAATPIFLGHAIGWLLVGVIGVVCGVFGRKFVAEKQAEFARRQAEGGRDLVFSEAGFDLSSSLLDFNDEWRKSALAAGGRLKRPWSEVDRVLIGKAVTQGATGAYTFGPLTKHNTPGLYFVMKSGKSQGWMDALIIINYGQLTASARTLADALKPYVRVEVDPRVDR